MQEKELGQHRINSTTATSLYSPGASTTGIILSIVVCNQSAAAATYRIFLDNDGTVYDQSTALFYDISIPANTTDPLKGRWGMNNSSGNLATRTSVANAITFTAHGFEIT